MPIDEQKQQELMFKFAIFEQQINQIQEQIKTINHALGDASSLTKGLDELINGKGKEIFASIGKGIYVKGQITDDKLIVDVGGKNFVCKSISETQELIKEQIKKLESAKKELEEHLEKINEELRSMIEENQEE